MNDTELSLVPLEARPYQGAPAGIITRVAANSVDALVVVLAVAGTYAGVVALTFVLDPRGFELPDPSFLVFVVGYLALLVVYLTAAWWVSGRTFGDHLMGIRVVTGTRSRLRLLQACARALVCAFFPIGLVWCVVDRDRRALHDLLLRTSVVYDWLPRPTARGGSRLADDSSPALSP